MKLYLQLGSIASTLRPQRHKYKIKPYLQLGSVASNLRPIFSFLFPCTFDFLIAGDDQLNLKCVTANQDIFVISNLKKKDIL